MLFQVAYELITYSFLHFILFLLLLFSFIISLKKI
jgi:hypothetical protein